MNTILKGLGSLCCVVAVSSRGVAIATRYILAFAALLLCGGAWAASTPKMLLNIRGNGDAVDGWVDNSQSSSGAVSIAVAASEDTGNLGFTADGNSSGKWWGNNPTVDFSSGFYVDVYGKVHTSIAEEVKASLGMDAELTTGVYMTGTRNGQTQERTGTITGLDPTKTYVVYIGIGTSDAGNKFKIQSSGYASCMAREYVTSTVTQYTSFAENTQIAPASGNVMAIRLRGVVPTDEGKIVFALEGNSGMSWLAVAEADGFATTQPIYYNQLAGSETIPAGTYGAITIDESTGGYKATTYSSNSGLSGTGVGSFAAAGSTKNGRKMIDTHTIAGWFKVETLPTGDATKDIFVMRCGTDSHNGYKVAVDANGALKFGRTNYNNGNYSWNDNKRVTLTGASEAIASGKWFHLAIACTYDSNGSYWHLTPAAWVNGVAASKSGDDCIDINLNGPGYVDDIRMGAGISAAGIYVDATAISDANIIKAIATDTTYVREVNSVYKATLSESKAFSAITWDKGTAPQAGDAAEITLDANVTLTLDTAITADIVKIIGTDKNLTLTGSSLDAANFAKLDFSSLSGKVIFLSDCTFVPTKAPSSGIAYRFEKDYSSDGFTLNMGAGTYEFKNAKITNGAGSSYKIKVSDGDSVKITNNSWNDLRAGESLEVSGGEVQIGKDGGNSAIWFGDGNTKIVQTGGTITGNATGTTQSGTGNGFLLGYSSTGITQFDVSGGVFQVPNSSLQAYLCGTVNLSGTGVMKAKGVFNGHNATTFNVATGGAFELGSLGWKDCPLTLNGGTFKAYETTTMAGATTISAASTIEVVENAELTITGTITGSSRDNKLTKTGAGTLILGEKRPVLDVVEGKVRLTATPEELAAGRLVLDVPNDASQAGDNKVEIYNANGDQMTITGVTLDEVNNQVIVQLQVNEPITADCNISDKVTESTTGIILIQGSTGEADTITINFDRADYPQDVSFQVTGNVAFTGTVPTSIISYESATIYVMSSMTFDVPTGVTAIIKGTISGDVSLSGAGTIKAADGAVINGNLNVTGNKFTLEGDLTLGGTGDSHIKGLTGGKLIKTGSGYLKLNNGTGNGHDGYDKYAIDGTTIQIDNGMVKVYNENSDARMYNPTFVIGTNGRLENYGWIGAKGTLTIENETDKVIFTNTDSYNVGGKSAELWGGPNIVKKGSGKATLCVGSHTGNSAEPFGMVTVNGGILEFGGTVAADLTSVGAGNGMLNLKHTGAVTTIKASIITSLKSNEANVTFIGSGDNGVVLDFGISTTGNKINSHLVFDAGTHVVIAGKSGSENMSDTGSLENPVMLVKNGTTLKYVMKDQNGWGTGTLNEKAVVKVEKGGLLELYNNKAYNLNNDNNTMFFQGRLVLSPGTTTTLYNLESAHQFKLSGADCGAGNVDKAQFYIPSPAEGATGDDCVAVFSKGTIAEQTTYGIKMGSASAITVDDRAIFRIDAPFEISQALHKYGTGMLILTDNSGSGVVTLHAGTIKSKTAFAANKIVPADPNKKVSASTEGEGENLLNVYTLAQRDATEIYPKTQSFDHFYLSDGTTEVTPIANDIIVIKNGIFNSDGRWKIALNHAVLSGHLFKVDYTGDDPGMTANSEIPSNFKIEIASGSCIYFRNGTCAINTGVVISGEGTLNLASNVIPVNGTVKITCPISRGTGSLQLSEGAQLVVENELASGVIASGVDGKVVKKVVNDDTTITYSLVAASPDAPITPGEGEIVISVVPVAGIAIEPGADVKVPTGTDASKIDVVYVAEDGTKTQLKSSGYVTVTVNATTGAIELTTTDSAKPAATAIAMATPTEEETDKVQFTITNPIPGLFYAVSSCDTPTGDFTSATGDQATSDAAKTVSIPMEFANGKKVKYYKVSVKATK